jgi:hypothetical protein
MSSVDKTFLAGVLATIALAGVICAVVYGIGVKPEVGALLITLGPVGAGLIADQVERHTPPKRRN